MRPAPLPKAWYWASEVAAICHVSKKTVYVWIQSGKILPILKIPPFKIPREQIEKLLTRYDL